jgi:hypothetical protein
MRVRSIFRFFLLFLVCLAAISNLVLGQETLSDEELDALSDEELELVCLVRGFELLKDQIDEATGEVYQLTHVDYVDAAKQCLAIEKEMYVLSAAINIGPNDKSQRLIIHFLAQLRNDLLEEHPELREELEGEIQKMQEEQAARIAELEGLQEQLLETESSDQSNDSGSENAAFVPNQTTTAENVEVGDGNTNPNLIGEEAGATSDEQANGQLLEEEPIEGVVEEDDNLHISEEEPMVAGEDGIEESTDDSDGLEAESTTSTEEDSDPIATTSTENNTSGDVTTEDRSNADDQTLAYLRQEFIQYVKKDIERVMKLLLPVLQPMLRAGDVAVKYIRAAFVTMQKTYDAHAQKEEEAGDNSAEAVES